ncbi:hypothetical protein BIFGAL_04238 [Bifidobacterium gallicum DSM 20093 = LMG 11596]|uniref:Uncharacterized protein n=1 Tax=Bifidobacterium gallicum DSM 20093 = LMG 11596 TaxID=561180 RepID=D1NWI5_9BIFI|nr:hypothetical protein BIFGAL_04238 [Bifidobacterium gallicum DSM 20093 = LMG 11596]
MVNRFILRSSVLQWHCRIQLCGFDARALGYSILISVIARKR